MRGFFVYGPSVAAQPSWVRSVSQRAPLAELRTLAGYRRRDGGAIRRMKGAFFMPPIWLRRSPVGFEAPGASTARSAENAEAWMPKAGITRSAMLGQGWRLQFFLESSTYSQAPGASTARSAENAEAWKTKAGVTRSAMLGQGWRLQFFLESSTYSQAPGASTASSAENA